MLYLDISELPIMFQINAFTRVANSDRKHAGETNGSSSTTAPSHPPKEKTNLQSMAFLLKVSVSDLQPRSGRSDRKHGDSVFPVILVLVHTAPRTGGTMVLLIHTKQLSSERN